MTANQTDAPALIGRRLECEALDKLLTDAHSGRSGVLVLRGEAGVGKTALLEYALQRVSGWRVVRAVGVESELEFAYSSLHQICSPLFGLFERLPEPQRDALDTVFGRSSGAAPDVFLVGLATLTLLAEAAEEQPLVCVIDDAQWLDETSAKVLGFVGRRLEAECIALICAARTGISDTIGAGLPELPIDGLGESDARSLLASNVRGPLDAEVREQIIAESHGNPLALLELPRTFSVSEFAGGHRLPAAHGVSKRIEASYARRIELLPRDAQLLMLVAAAEPLGDSMVLHHAAKTLEIDVATATTIEGAGLLSIGARVEFSHPLIRSAVYGSASVEDRHRVHRALAEATNVDTDPDRRAWHLAQGTARPDENVALALEKSAERAQRRGGFAAAAAFLVRAVALSADPARRTDRTLAAAEASLNAGDLATAKRLLSLTSAGSLEDLQDARLGVVRAQVAFAESRGSDAPPLLLQAAKTLEGLDPKLARETYLEAWSAALFAGRLAKDVDLLAISRAAQQAPRAAGDPSALDLLLEAYALLVTNGYPTAMPALKRVAKTFAGDDATAEEALRFGWLAAGAGGMLWDYDTFLTISNRSVEAARAAGAYTVLAVSLNILAQAVAVRGASEEAARLSREAEAITDATGTPVVAAGALVLAALRGNEQDADALIDLTIQGATASGQGIALQFALWARALVLNGLGRYPEALEAARDATDDGPGYLSLWTRIELVEAASRCGYLDVARSALDRLTECTHAIRSDWGLGVEARLRALVTNGEDAEALYREAVERLGRTRLRPDFGRAALLYGEWLRREGRRLDARAELRTAYDVFTATGMEAFAERARRELAATGETVRKRTVSTSDDLTPQERHIAELARDGLANQEIGARLFLSTRTIEWHLRHVYIKLGISSRKELRKALPDNQVLAPTKQR
jgi:DNA-binding CsgD family transcriptional regulator